MNSCVSWIEDIIIIIYDYNGLHDPYRTILPWKDLFEINITYIVLESHHIKTSLHDILQHQGKKAHCRSLGGCMDRSLYIIRPLGDACTNSILYRTASPSGSRERYSQDLIIILPDERYFTHNSVIAEYSPTSLGQLYTTAHQCPTDSELDQPNQF